MLRFCNQLRVRVYVANMLPWYDRLSCYSQCEVHRHGLEDLGLLSFLPSRLQMHLGCVLLCSILRARCALSSFREG